MQKRIKTSFQNFSGARRKKNACPRLRSGMWDLLFILYFYSNQSMEDILNTPEANQLFHALVGIQNTQDMKNVMRDLCTISELKSMIERLEVARRVNAGETYRHIAEETGVSSATITRVAHWLKYGNRGYQLIIGI